MPLHAWKCMTFISTTQLTADCPVAWCVPPFIIIIGKTALFEPQPSLEYSARFHPVFTSLDFATIIIFTEQGLQPCIQPPIWRSKSLYVCPPVTGWPPGTGFPFRRLLQLAGLRWRYSNPPPQGEYHHSLRQIILQKRWMDETKTSVYRKIYPVLITGTEVCVQLIILGYV
jgi:hypothetical protein